MSHLSRCTMRWTLALAVMSGALAAPWRAMSAQVAGQLQTPAAGSPEERAQLEQQFRHQLAQIVKERLQLSDDQFRKLVETNQRYEGQRRDLVKQERDILLGLRSEQQSATPNQQRVSQLIDQRLQIEQQRLAITQQEQRELGTFLTPVQRAQYGALQEQIRRRLQEIRRRRLEDPNAVLGDKAAERQEKRAERQAEKRAARRRTPRVP